MPNFDGTGPLRRGRVIGRGQGPCGKQAGEKSSRKDERDAGQKEPVSG